MNPRLLLLLFLAAATLLRWLLAATHDLSPAEAYLALCGFTPAIAFFDGPAGTALSVAWGTSLAGAGGLGAALLWPVFAAGATVALYFLVCPLAGRPAACGTAVLLNLLPAFNNAAIHPSSAMPVTMFALIFFAAAWRAAETPAPTAWIVAGVAAAGALVFSYAGLFLFPALAPALVFTRRWRQCLLRPGFWAASLPAAAVLGLLLVWNSTHGWVHFIGGTWRTALTLQPSNLPAGLMTLFLGLSPFVPPALAAGAFFALREAGSAPKARFAAFPAVIAGLVALYWLLRGGDTSASALAAAALALPLLAWIPAELSRYSLPLVMISAALWTTATIAWHPAQPADLNPSVAREIEALRQEESRRLPSPVFLIAEDAALASALALHLPDHSFATPGHPPVYVPESPFADSQYALWPRYDQFVAAAPDTTPASDDPFTEQDGINPFLGRSALYVTTQTPDQLPQSVTAAFAAWRLLAEITTPSGRILRVYLLGDYQTLPL